MLSFITLFIKGQKRFCKFRYISTICIFTFDPHNVAPFYFLGPKQTYKNEPRT